MCRHYTPWDVRSFDRDGDALDEADAREDAEEDDTEREPAPVADD